MKNRSASRNGIVHELLTGDNYERWRSLIQNYLEGQGLLDVVKCVEVEDNSKIKSWHFFHHRNRPDQSNVSPDIEQGLSGFVESVSEVGNSWKMKNANALHIIQLSCGPEILDKISHLKTAESVWNYLSKQYDSNLKGTQDTDQVIFDDNLSMSEKVWFRKMESGKTLGHYEIDSIQDICITLASGRTLLHVAVMAGNKENVEILVEKGEERLVYKQDNCGYTALALSACTGEVEIVKWMIENKRYMTKLLALQNKDGEIPVLIAAASGHKEMTSYLYEKTPLEVFDNDSKNQVLLLSRCITAKIFDVALRLLQRSKDLSRKSLLSKISAPKSHRLSYIDLSNQKPSCVEISPLIVLAQMASSFPSGSRYSFRQQFIYDNLSVENAFKVNHGTLMFRNPNKNALHDVAKFFLGFIPVVAFAVVTKQLKTFLINSMNWRCLWKLVLRLLFIPIKLLGLLLGVMAYLFIQIFKYQDIFGIKKIYDLKYTHYEVQTILKHFQQTIIEFNDEEIKKALVHEAMINASQYGTMEFIDVMMYPARDLPFRVDRFGRDIFSYSILNRKQNVLNKLLFRKEIFRHRTDIFGNNLLHLAAKLGPSSSHASRSGGAALQMQRETQWFKEVEKLALPYHKEAKNNDGKKPREVFEESHSELMQLGEKWINDTSNSFTVVSTLIITIAFAAIFTVPGGNNGESGMPIFLHDNAFTAFVILDTISLFTSATSILILIQILTTRLTKEEYFANIPLKLLHALCFLFIAICCMILVFCVTIIMTIKGYSTVNWSFVALAMFLVSFPVIFLLFTQMSLIYEILVHRYHIEEDKFLKIVTFEDKSF